ncbi:hypothetical protein EXN66_Car000189 [Channa argus]|uniref:Uncharacterized protein n=1 Tax=Channa argus TaxID=215402 RepID=A0A6G1QWL2_CHAAH|nr:hypothetical protein EXN66_Car000184 [Channa argus]KAF3707017.1 hypothetical protein EXN66_Car000189 [Channa argus]
MPVTQRSVCALTMTILTSLPLRVFAAEVELQRWSCHTATGAAITHIQQEVTTSGKCTKLTDQKMLVTCISKSAEGNLIKLKKCKI